MTAHVATVAFEGIEATGIDVQVQMVSGLPSFTIVGLPDKAVGESKERVRAAIHALGLSLPVKRIIVNLAPADILKEGSHFDLPIAIGLLIGMGVLPQDELENFVALGELSLDGALQPVSGVLPAALYALAQDKASFARKPRAAKRHGRGLIRCLLHRPCSHSSIITKARRCSASPPAKPILPRIAVPTCAKFAGSILLAAHLKSPLPVAIICS
jgi:magnesium chelatase family protein